MFCACITGDLDTVKQLVTKDLSLVRSQYEYRTPLYFAVRENQLEVAAFLLDHRDALVLSDPLEIARDRGYVDMQRLLESRYASLHGASSKKQWLQPFVNATQKMCDSCSTKRLSCSTQETGAPISRSIGP